MIIKKTIINDIIKRDLYLRNELIFRIVNILTRLRKVNLFDLLNITLKDNRCSFFSIINDRCFLTSRSKSIIRKVKLSRIKFKEFINNGLLIGFNKYSW